MTGPHGPPFRLRLTPLADARWQGLARTNPSRFKKVRKALRLLSENPAHPGLGVHKWEILKGTAPDGGDIWTAYVENNTPSAWRIFFFYDSRDPGLIYVTSIEPHR